jgi:hypothetical protein
MLMAPLGEVHELIGTVLPVILIVGLLFCTTAVAVLVQPVATEVTVTVYDPGGTLDKSSEVCPPAHRKLYEPAGVTLRLTDPLLCPQVAAVVETDVFGGGALELTVNEELAVQPPALETVTV